MEVKNLQQSYDFRYSLAKADTNGDSTPDLLVGAPFHDGFQGRGGAVYLFVSNPLSSDLEPHKSVKVMGRERESQFGISISSAGDLNRDGYEDFAVGAPYESSGLKTSDHGPIHLIAWLH